MPFSYDSFSIKLSYFENSFSFPAAKFLFQRAPVSPFLFLLFIPQFTGELIADSGPCNLPCKCEWCHSVSVTFSLGNVLLPNGIISGKLFEANVLRASLRVAHLDLKQRNMADSRK